MQKTILKIYKSILTICVPYLLITMFTDFGIPCLFRRTTGFLCPGCGATRMFGALARFDIYTAFRYNAAIFLLFFLWNGIAAMCYFGKPAFVQSTRFLCTMFYLTIAFLVLFGIIRNVY